MDYDVLIIGAGPGGIFTAYELTEKSTKPLKTAVFELGKRLDQRKCPIDGEKIRSCQDNEGIDELFHAVYIFDVSFQDYARLPPTMSSSSLVMACWRRLLYSRVSCSSSSSALSLASCIATVRAACSAAQLSSSTV